MGGCHSSDELSSTGAPTTTAPVATVNGDPIAASMMFDAMQHYVPVKNQGDLNSPSLTQPVGRVVLSELIQNTILIQMAKLQNVPVADSEVADRYAYIKLLEEHSNTTKPFESYLADEGYTPESFQTEQIKPLIARLNLVSQNQTIMDAAVQSYFQQHPEKYSYPAAVHIARIVLPDQTMAQAAQADAQKTGSFKNFLGSNIDDPLTDGADSSDLAKWEPLSGPGAPFPPSLLAPLMAAKAGDVLPPMQLQPSQWWVIRVVAKQPAGTLPFDQIKSQVKLDALSDQGMHSASVLDLQRSLAQAVQTASITIGPKQYQSLVVELKAKPKPTVPASAPQPAPSPGSTSSSPH
jgi:parvulin-like peptidyl-prolyl isomerase